MKSTTLTQFTLVRLVLQATVLLSAFLWAGTSLAATLSLSPNTGVYTAGQTFTARVNVNTAGAAINAAEGMLSFKPTELSVVSVSKGTIFNLWTSEPSFSNTAGTINFSGGTPTGYTGAGGTVLSVTFRAKAAGSPKVNFSSGAVLAADGRGTNVLTGMSGGTFTVSAESTTPQAETIIEYVPPANTPGAPSITSATHPDQSLWYTNKSASLSWSIPSGVVAVRTLLDTRSTSVPTKVYDTPLSSITLNDLDEGVQYFHVQFKNADGWGKVSHYRLAVDSVAPKSFEVTLMDDADLSNPEQVLTVVAEDETSKVMRFKVQVDGAEPYEIINAATSSTLTLSKLEPGYHTVVVEAFDEAGNSIIDSISFTILAFDKPQFTDVPTTVNEGVIPVFKGVTRPNSEVVVTLKRMGNEPQETSLRSNEAGEFNFIPDGKLGEGVYELTARAVDQYGALSEVSDPARFAVQQAGLIRIGSFLVSVLSVVVPLLLLAGFSILATLFLFRRGRAMRVNVSREAHEAVGILNREFEALRGTVNGYAEELKAGRKTNKLTKAEADLITDLTTALKTAQQTIVKEITDVEAIVE